MRIFYQTDIPVLQYEVRNLWYLVDLKLTKFITKIYKRLVIKIK